VLDRYIKTAKQCKADAIVRITGDCPLVDPFLVDECIHRFKETKVDYHSNIRPPTFSDGLDIEVIKYSVLKKAAQETTRISHRKHVTPYLCESDNFIKSNYSYTEDLSALSWTVDEPEDFEIISKVFEHFQLNIYS